MRKLLFTLAVVMATYTYGQTIHVDILSDTMSENGGWALIEVTTDAGPVEVELHCSDQTEARLDQDTITVDAGGFLLLDAVDDDIFDLTRRVTITATAPGYVSGSDSIDILDDETLTPEGLMEPPDWWVEEWYGESGYAPAWTGADLQAFWESEYGDSADIYADTTGWTDEDWGFWWSIDGHRLYEWYHATDYVPFDSDLEGPPDPMDDPYNP